MSTLQTFRFWLEPDTEIPRFKRLHWDFVDVPVADVLLQGIHPWMGPDKHLSLIEKFVERVNAEPSKVSDLVPMGLSHDIIADGGYVWNHNCRFQRTLKSLQESAYFVDHLSYVSLLEIAKGRLRERWSHSLAKTLAEKAHCGFQELRQFLKGKKRDIKLSSYSEIDRYDLSRILSLEDFEQRDKLLIGEGIPSQNFRQSALLERIADEQGRLRLVKEIRNLSLAVILRSENPRVCGTHVQCHVTRSGNMLTFRPDIGGSQSKRDAAEVFAERWRIGDGRFVFRSTVDKLTEMVDRDDASPTFPSLNYASKEYVPAASAEVDASRVRAFHIGKFPTDKCTGDTLKEVLREHGASMNGNKDELVTKLATLAAKVYERRLPELDRYFGEHRYVRMASSPATTGDFPILEELRYLRNLVLSMYALRHMRGNAILEANHENATYSPEELALALVTGKVGLSGAFLRVA